MKYLRLYPDQDGESHFEEIEAIYTPLEHAPPVPSIELSAPVDATRYAMVRFPAGWDSGLHQVPCRQLFVKISDEIGCTVSDGSTVTLSAGETLLMEDTAGNGHSAKVISEIHIFALMAHLE